MFGVDLSEAWLNYLETLPSWMKHDVVLFTKPGCGHCVRAKSALAEKGIPYAELPTSPRILRALPGARTTPLVFVDGKHIGGADELVVWLGAIA